MAGNAKLLATALSGAPTLSFQRVFPKIDARTLEPVRIVQNLLADWRPDREAVVLSAEDFDPTQATRLQQLLPAADITVVLFVRTQDRWMESYYNQLIKTGDVHQNLQSFIADTLGQQISRLYYPDWWAHFKGWQDSIGSCSVRFYNEVQLDLFGAFFQAAGLPVPKGIAEIPRQTGSIDLYQITYLISLDSEIPFADFIRRRRASAEAAGQLGGPEARILRSSDRDHLRDHFSASNARLLAALGRPGDDPALRFAEPEQQPLTTEEVLASEPFRQHKVLADEIYAGLDR